MVLIYRTVIIFAIVTLSMRIMGKRQLGQLELNELVVAVMISEVATIPISDTNLSIWKGIIPVTILFICEVIISLISMKSIKFRGIISGYPSIIVQSGEIVQKEMKKNRFTLDELTEGLRAQGITDISTIKYAILEIDGSLSTVLYNEFSPVINKSLNVDEPDKGLPIMVVNDGRVLKHNLKLLGLNESWLSKELQNRNAKGPKDVFMLSVDECGNIYYTPKQ